MAADPPRPSRALSIGAIVAAAAILAASLVPLPHLWGLAAPAFLPPPAHGAVGALLLIAAGLALPIGRAAAGRGPAGRGGRPAGRGGPAGAGLLSGGIPLLALPAFCLAFWLLRDRAHLLGDGLIYLDNILRGVHRLYSEPLAAWAWYGYAALLKALGWTASETSVPTLSMLCGAAAAALSWGVACRLFREPGDRITTAGLLFLTGTAQFWFGYVESYPLASVAVLLYLYTLLSCADGTLPAAAAGAALAVAVATHLALAFLVPSYVLLLLGRRRPVPALLLAAVAPVLLAMLLLASAGMTARSVLEPIRLVRGAAGLSGASALARIPSIVGHRIPDLINLILLVAPAQATLGLTLLVSRLRSGRKGPARAAGTPRAPGTAPSPPPAGAPALRLLLAAAIPGVLLTLALSLAVSPTQDWDLMTVPLLPALALLAATSARALHASPGRIRAAWLTLALAPTLGFVLVSANPAAAARRYESLLSPSILLSPHERAYGNEKEARFHRDRGDIEEELVFDRRALEAEPGNARYWGAVGLALYRLGRLDEAVPYMREASRRDPRNTEGLYYFGTLLLQAGRDREAVQVLRRVVTVTGSAPGPRRALAAAYAALGDTAAARSIVESLPAR